MLFCMTRSLFGVLLLVSFFGGSYLWYTAAAVCPIPISYRVGEVDTAFGISEADARTAISEAESLWEDATGRNLFTYDEDAGELVINFIYDERQELTDVQELFTDSLDKAAEMNAELAAEYEAQITAYTTQKEQYELRVVAYEQALQKYNDEVAYWNAQGGAPESEYTALNERKNSLASEHRAVEVEREELNEKVDAINVLSDQANQLVDRYNRGVQRYNDTFSEPTEFTQGDYQSDVIHIYQFNTHEELVLVLAHEMGHALGIGHVANPASLMYYKMEEQSTDVGISTEDLEDFTMVCGDGSTFSKLKFW